jgi:hypothetical protein
VSASNAISTMPKTYATRKNERFSNNNSSFVSISDRWRSSVSGLPAVQQRIISATMQQVVAEFKRRNPHIKTWNDIELAEARSAKLSEISIDVTMQRPLNAEWALNLLSKFSPTMVMPIHVYRDSSHPNLIAWDGQHTSVLLWLIATQVIGCKPEDCEVPINLYKAKGKAEMRVNFITLHSDEGKKHLDDLDRFEQMVYGVRVDRNTTNQSWVIAEEKQRKLEENDLFVTHKKYGDEHEPNAISRMPEINRISPETLGWLGFYLALATQGSRAVEEKEMAMMSNFFSLCSMDGIAVDDAYITDLVSLFRRTFNCDFSPDGPFWAKASIAYKNWHTAMLASNAQLNNQITAKLSKEPSHGEPFMLALLEKSFSRPIPKGRSSTPFWPSKADLW